MPKNKEPKWLRAWKRRQSKAEKDWSSYTERDAVLRELGFDCYADYLASPLWQKIRERRLKAQVTCSCCDKEAAVVHHGAYYKDVLLGDEPAISRYLYPLCHSCHFRVEFAGERKRSSGEASEQLRRMLFKHRNGVSRSQMIRQKIAARRARQKERRDACAGKKKRIPK